jgi:hypothetical protein
MQERQGFFYGEGGVDKLWKNGGKIPGNGWKRAKEKEAKGSPED